MSNQRGRATFLGAVKRTPSRRSRISFLAIFAFALTGGCDDGDVSCSGPIEESRFDYPADEVVTRDNILASGVYWEGNGDGDGDGDNEATALDENSGIYHTNTGDFRAIDVEYLGPVGEGELYNFAANPGELPFALEPGVVNSLELRRAANDASPIVSTTATLDDETLVFPVYTWNFISEDDGLGVPDIDERAAKFLFDRASGNNRPADLEDNYWAHERPDQLWEQCGIQFRHMGHTEVIVPDCWTNSVWSLTKTVVHSPWMSAAPTAPTRSKILQIVRSKT